MHSVVEDLWDPSGPGLPRSYSRSLQNSELDYSGWLPQPEALIALVKKRS